MNATTKTAHIRLPRSSPAYWRITFDNPPLNVQIDFTPGSRFACPNCGAADCQAYDTQQKTWRHLNFCQHQTYLDVRVPRVCCETCGMFAEDLAAHGGGPGAIEEVCIDMSPACILARTVLCRENGDERVDRQ